MSIYDTGGIAICIVDGFEFKFVRAFGQDGILLSKDMLDHMPYLMLKELDGFDFSGFENLYQRFMTALSQASCSYTAFVNLCAILDASVTTRIKSEELSNLSKLIDLIDHVVCEESQSLWPISVEQLETLEDFRTRLMHEITKRQSIAQRKPVKGYVYVIKSPTGAYKIGKTKNPADRLRIFAVKLPFEVQFIHIIPTEDMAKLEKDLHHKYKHKRVNGEWFNLSDDDIDDLKGLTK